MTVLVKVQLSPLIYAMILRLFGCAQEGCAPRAAVIKASDCYLYGTTSQGGSLGGVLVEREIQPRKGHVPSGDIPLPCSFIWSCNNTDPRYIENSK